MEEEPDDPTRAVRRRRALDILEARKRVREQRNHAMDLLYSGEINEQAAETIIRNAVEDYFLESEQTIQGEIPDDSDEIEAQYDEDNPKENIAIWAWFAADLGTLVMPEIGETGKQLHFQGLRDYWNCQNPIIKRTEEVVQSPMEGRKKVQKTRKYQIPEHVSMEAYRVLNEFWKEHGLDYEVDDDEDDKWQHDEVDEDDLNQEEATVV